jgi:hypothetical protein
MREGTQIREPEGVNGLLCTFLCTTLFLGLAVSVRKEMVGTRRLELLTSTVSKVMY